MRRFRLQVAYVGTAYHGWQYQPDVPTVAGELRRAIAELVGHDVDPPDALLVRSADLHSVEIPPSVLAIKKHSINRAMEAQGFLSAVNAISESDAILHLEPAVLAMRQRIADEGLMDVVKSYRGESSTQIFNRFKKD